MHRRRSRNGRQEGQQEKRMGRDSLRYVKWLVVAVTLACVACGGSPEKQADYPSSNVATGGASYPSPPPQAMSASPGAQVQAESMHTQSSPASAESYSFSDDAM